MRTLTYLDEFRTEADNALFTKAQALAVAGKLLELERNDPNNSEEDVALFDRAIQRADFRYIDQTKTETDRILDECGVARITAQDIVEAIRTLLFDVG